MEKATFGAGCFWGVEATFRSIPGVTSTLVGYCGGKTDNPTYQDVCTDTTGHAEVVEITFDPAQLPYEQLLETFWKLHDPTTPNRQGPDVGSQYRSVIFFTRRRRKRRRARPKNDSINPASSAILSLRRSSRPRRFTKPRIITSATWRNADSRAVTSESVTPLQKNTKSPGAILDSGAERRWPEPLRGEGEPQGWGEQKPRKRGVLNFRIPVRAFRRRFLRIPPWAGVPFPADARVGWPTSLFQSLCPPPSWLFPTSPLLACSHPIFHNT